ncbi:MAG: hypothetical protein V1685_06535 [Parcubacteria group bacterium]
MSQTGSKPSQVEDVTQVCPSCSANALVLVGRMTQSPAKPVMTCVSDLSGCGREFMGDTPTDDDVFARPVAGICARNGKDGHHGQFTPTAAGRRRGYQKIVF